MRIFIDESGDLGFDFSRGASSYFCITAVVLQDDKSLKYLEKAVRNTIKRKVHAKKSRKEKPVNELKGSRTSIVVKEYFWRQVKQVPFELHAVVFEKQKVNPSLQRQKDRIYNHLAYLVVNGINLKKAKDHLYVQIDASKGKYGREEFNGELKDQIQARIPLNMPLTIEHPQSERSKGIQVADMFAWGISRKYETGQIHWYEKFQDRIMNGGERLFVPPTDWQ